MNRPTGQQAEFVEAKAWTQLQRALSPAFRERMGVRVSEIAGAFAFITSGSTELAVNRVLGLGLTLPTTPADLDELLASYSNANVARFLVQLVPDSMPREMHAWLLARGLELHARGSLKLWRSTAITDDEISDSRVHVEEISPADARTFVDIVARPLAVPIEMEEGISSTIGHPGWHYYLASIDQRPVAGAALFVAGDIAWCGLCATGEDDRGKGAQSALIRRRIHDARAAGCQWIVAETLPDLPNRPNPSLRNLQRLGFDVLYERRNFAFPRLPATP